MARKKILGIDYFVCTHCGLPLFPESEHWKNNVGKFSCALENNMYYCLDFKCNKNNRLTVDTYFTI